MTYLVRSSLAGIAVLIAVSSCGGSGHKAPSAATPTTSGVGTSAADWVAYRTPSGISMTKPASWPVAAGAADLLTIYMDPAGFIRRSISISHPRQRQSVSLAQFSFATKLLLKRTAGFKESGSGQVTLSGQPGQQETYTETVSNESLEILAEWTVIGGQPWLVTYTSDEPRFGSGLSQARHLINSLSLPS
jgi:hypothetical protein